MLNVHHMHTLVCDLFKWNYEHTFIPMVNRFASLDVPSKVSIIVENALNAVMAVISF